jgi:hypothetical protein
LDARAGGETAESRVAPKIACSFLTENLKFKESLPHRGPANIAKFANSEFFQDDLP